MLASTKILTDVRTKSDIGIILESSSIGCEQEVDNDSSITLFRIKPSWAPLLPYDQVKLSTNLTSFLVSVSPHQIRNKCKGDWHA